MPTPSGPTSDWIRRFHPAPAAASRLVCFPHAGGSATYYYPVSQALAPEVDVLAVQYPGRQDRRAEPCVDDVGALADAIVPELMPWTDRPVTLFGHSLGATVAFEVARRLERWAVRPLGLFASGRRAPSRHRPQPDSRFSDEELLEELTSMSGTDSQVLADPELLAVILPVMRADYRAAQSYRYRSGPKLSCPVHALIGDADPQVSVDEARSWGEHSTGRFELTVYPGGHFYLNDHLAAVTATLSAFVARAAPPARTRSA
jgi:pyochelin biosynthetic protein PchC